MRQKNFTMVRCAMASALAVCIAVSMATLHGCVRSKPIDGGVVSEYQRAMAGRMPQPRGDRDSEGFFTPAAAVELPSLNIEGQDPRRVELSLDDAIVCALAGNPEIAVASFDPAISREDMTRAAAEFDLVANAGFGYQQQDMPTDSTFRGGQSDVREFSAGFAQKLITGAEWTLDWSMTRTWDNNAFRTLSTRYEPTLALEVTQPLLRGGWPEYNLSRLRLARLTHRQSLSEFRQTVEQVVTEVRTSYWRLKQAREDVRIQEELLDATRRTLRQVEARRDVDAPARTVIAQVEASLRAREAALVLARKQAEDAAEELARLVSHPDIGPLEDFELVLTTEPPTRPVKLDRRQELRTAIEHSPLLEQARLAIAAADIEVRVAENEILPRLDVTGSASVDGLGGTSGDANDDFWTFDYVSYSIAVRMEYPPGNRAARAQLRGSRYQRRQALARMQDAADRVSQRVNERVRAVETAWRRIEVQKAAVDAARAQAEGLEERLVIQQKTPEFLLVLLQAQQTLAEARRSLWQARTDYNVARLELAQVTGTVLQKQQVRIALPDSPTEGE
ncbi:MAG: TolC family protein [Phycisphaerae bacterium]